MATSPLCFLETQRILNIIDEESAEQVERIEIKLLYGEWKWNVPSFIEIFAVKDNLTRVSLEYISCLAVDQIAKVVDGSTLFVK